MKAVSIVFRVLVALAGVFLLWQLIVRVTVEVYAGSGTMEGYEKAIRMQPDNADLVSGRAVFLAENGDQSPAVDKALDQAIEMNPADVEALMSRAFREELRGDTKGAQADMERAATVSHLFKPAWTLVNFYFRTGQDARFWPMLERCLAMIEPKSLHPVTFDPSPLFDLAWHEDPDASRIRALIPRREETLVPYLRWLSDTGRLDAALEVWPDALALVDPAYQADQDVALGFIERLMAGSRSAEAVTAWNDLVKRGLVQSAALDPAAGNAVENPEFVFPSIRRAFSWYPARETGVFVTQGPQALRYELTGSEPEAFELLWKLLPVTPGRTWNLAWEADTSRLENLPTAGSGLSFTLDEAPVALGHGCAPLGREGKGSCLVAPMPATRVLRLSLRYQRPAGATRLKGVLVLSRIWLEAARQ